MLSRNPPHPISPLLALLALAVALPAAAAAAVPAIRPALPEAVYHIRLRASYDPETRLLRGHEHLRWRNTASVAVEELRFHHYLNAFANNRSTFLRGSGGRLRGGEMGADDWGWIETGSVRLAGGANLKAVEEYIAPDDGNPDDRTVARYPLPAPLAPGGWIELEIDFQARLPRVLARTGAAGDFVVGGQWFPKIGVFEDAGTRGRRRAGWNCHQFHAESEFYADFGDYDVTLTLPARYRGRIGATGRLVEEAVEESTDGGATVSARFVQAGVHDFAWTADPRFEVVRERFDPARDVAPETRTEAARLLGLTAPETALAPVELVLLVQPPHRAQARRYLGAARATLAHLGLYLGAYPYPTLTLVDPPPGEWGAAGMEYPTFVTLGTSALFTLPGLRGVQLPEIVTVHEIAHQYWQGLVASNEFEESWMDEGITSYYELRVLETSYGGLTARLPGLAVPAFETNRAEALGKPFHDPVVTPAWGFLDEGSYGVNSYPRPALALRQLENLLGAETFHRAMRAFFQRFRGRHPGTADFEKTFAEHAGRPLGWFFRQAFHSTRALDYAVTRVESAAVPEPEPEGVFWRGGERLEEAPPSSPAAPERYRSTAVVSRQGEFRHPVEVEFRFADGTTLRRRWSGGPRWARWTFTGPSPLVSAEVDPDHLLALDRDRLDNGRSAEPDPRPARRLLLSALFALQTLFEALTLFA